MRGWHLLGLVVAVGGFLFYVDRHLEDFGLGKALQVRRHNDDLSNAIQSAQLAQTRQKSELMAMREIMSEIDHQPARTGAQAAEGADAPEANPAATVGPHGRRMVGVDPRAIEKIQSWNISNEMKAKILRAYKETGYLPVAPGQPNADVSRAPASIHLPNGSYVEASPETTPTTAR